MWILHLDFQAEDPSSILSLYRYRPPEFFNAVQMKFNFDFLIIKYGIHTPTIALPNRGLPIVPHLIMPALIAPDGLRTPVICKLTPLHVLSRVTSSNSTAVRTHLSGIGVCKTTSNSKYITRDLLDGMLARAASILCTYKFARGPMLRRFNA